MKTVYNGTLNMRLVRLLDKSQIAREERHGIGKYGKQMLLPWRGCKNIYILVQNILDNTDDTDKKSISLSYI